MTRTLSFLVVLFACATVFAPITIAQTIPAEIKKVVTFIFPADGQGNLLREPKTNSPIPYGTGFFVGVKNDNGNGIYGYLVTAKHVLKDEYGNDFIRIYLRMDTLKGDAAFIPLDATCPVVPGSSISREGVAEPLAVGGAIYHIRGYLEQRDKPPLDLIQDPKRSASCLFAPRPVSGYSRSTFITIRSSV